MFAKKLVNLETMPNIKSSLKNLPSGKTRCELLGVCQAKTCPPCIYQVEHVPRLKKWLEAFRSFFSPKK